VVVVVIVKDELESKRSNTKESWISMANSRIVEERRSGEGT
jgi:hypothetical protein